MSAASVAEPVDFITGAPTPSGSLQVSWRHEVRHVMGCHIEMSRDPGRSYPMGTTYQPEEPPLQMTVAQLIDIRDAAVAVADSPGAHTFEHFAIFNGP